MNREIFAVFPTEAVVAIEFILMGGDLQSRFLNDGRGMIIVTGVGFDGHFMPRSKVIKAFSLHDGVAVSLPYTIEVNDFVLTDEYTGVLV